MGQGVGWVWGSPGACGAVRAVPDWLGGEGWSDTHPPPAHLCALDVPPRARGCVPGRGGGHIPGHNCTTVFTLFYPRSTEVPPGTPQPCEGLPLPSASAVLTFNKAFCNGTRRCSDPPSWSDALPNPYPPWAAHPAPTQCCCTNPPRKEQHRLGASSRAFIKGGGYTAHGGVGSGVWGPDP